MKRLVILTAAAACATTACDTQRDLYVEVSPTIRVEGNWLPSLDRADMSMDATVLSYSGGTLFAKDFFYDADRTTVPVASGGVDVMIFNGLMYDAGDTHLDGVIFRGVDRLETFEAVATEADPIRRMGRAEGEYIATNNMEIFTSMTARENVEAGSGYFLKYRNGRNQGEIPHGVVEAELELTPVAMSYPMQIVVEIVNISSAYGANASLHGFVGSAFAAQRRPSHFMVTHQFNLNNKRILDADADRGTIESPVFVTFGPPVDLPDNTYQVYVRITLVNGETFERTFDVTEQVLPFIDAVRQNIEGTGPIRNKLSLTLPIELTLPEVEPVEGIIGIGDWDDDEIIKVPITP